MKKYESLKAKYPERISLNQLYQICRISKRSARYLLKNGVIPCIENSGNKTWRYSIAIDDVITYLRRREQWGSMIPKGMANNAREKKHLPPICTDDKKKVISYFRIYVENDKVNH